MNKAVPFFECRRLKKEREGWEESPVVITSTNDPAACTDSLSNNFILVSDEVYCRGIIHKLYDVVLSGGWQTVMGEQGEEQWAEHTSLWGPCTQSDGLWGVSVWRSSTHYREKYWVPHDKVFLKDVKEWCWMCWCVVVNWNPKPAFACILLFESRWVKSSCGGIMWTCMQPELGRNSEDRWS